MGIRWAAKGTCIATNCDWGSGRIDDVVSSPENRLNTRHDEDWVQTGPSFLLEGNRDIDLQGSWANDELTSHKWVS